MAEVQEVTAVQQYGDCDFYLSQKSHCPHPVP